MCTYNKCLENMYRSYDATMLHIDEDKQVFQHKVFLLLRDILCNSYMLMVCMHTLFSLPFFLCHAWKIVKFPIPGGISHIYGYPTLRFIFVYLFIYLQGRWGKNANIHIFYLMYTNFIRLSYFLLHLWF